MAWPKEHKTQTRERIIEAAAAAFRARGVSGVRVQEIMADAGLTHGGFYAHFESKDDLVGAALEHAAAQTQERFSANLEKMPAEERMRALIDSYLSPGHAAHPEQGCPVAAIGSEIARDGGPQRQRMARGIRKRLEWMRGLLENKRRDQLQYDAAVGVLATMVGGMILARAVGGRESAAILEACRQFLHASLETHGPDSGE